MNFFRTSSLRTFHSVKTSPRIQEDRLEFMKVFPLVVKNLACGEEDQINKRMANVLEQNVTNGSKSRGIAVVSTYKALENPNNLTSENIRLASILGWCLEINQSAILIQDDIYDAGETRRGTTCWYKTMGMAALNDSVLLENSVFRLLKQHFSSHPSYAKFMECFHEASLATAMGEILETIFINEGRANVNTLTPARFDTLIRYKTQPYAFLFPVNLGFHLAEKFDPAIQEQLSPILKEMGHLLQVANDYSDCFGDPISTGKIGTDIKEGKISWLITTALQRATPTQRDALSTNYGKNCSEAVWKVKEIYEELNMRGVFREHEEQQLGSIGFQIERILADFPHHQTFLEYLMGLVQLNNWREREWWYF